MATFWAILGKIGNFLLHHLVTLHTTILSLALERERGNKNRQDRKIRSLLLRGGDLHTKFTVCHCSLQYCYHEGITQHTCLLLPCHTKWGDDGDNIFLRISRSLMARRSIGINALIFWHLALGSLCERRN